MPARSIGRAPNFLVIGAGKSGTTSLWSQLRQHPQIYMHASKQLHYFDESAMATPFRGPPPNYHRNMVKRDWAGYRAEFSAAADRLAAGEACNSYLCSPDAARRIAEKLPNARLIALLRHPADRAFSRYLQLRSSGREPLNFGEAIRSEETRIGENWWPDFYYLKAGLYHEQLMRYAAHFPRQQIKICLHDDMVADPLGMLRDIFSFLGVDSDFIPNIDVRYSPSGLPRSRGVDWALRRLRSARPLAERFLREQQLGYLLRIAGKAYAQNLVKPRMEPADRSWLIDRYRDDALKLQEYLGRDLSAWLV